MKTVYALSKFLEKNSIQGFLAINEAQRLMALAEQACKLGPVLEIGSYCGKSSVYLGEVCKAYETALFCVDHHRGSEEHQLGEQYHDTSLYDASIKRMDSLPQFRRTLFLAELEDTAIPIIASSKQLESYWALPLGMVFVDGGHSDEAARFDCTAWARHIAKGGLLVVHDLFEHPSEGGQAPYNAFNAVYEQGGWEKLEQVASLGVLKKI